MDIITDLLNIPQKDVLSSSRSENGSLIIDITLVSKKFSCPSCGFSPTHIKDYKTKSITHSALYSRSCLIRYRARHFVCAICGRYFLNQIPSCLPGIL